MINIIKLSPKLLMSFFMLAPFLVVIALFDMLFFEKKFFEYLPNQPQEWAFWFVIFSLPHIISSFITIIDTQNIKLYKKKISGSILILVILSIIILGVVPSYLDPVDSYYYQVTIFGIYSFFTLYHVTTQQLGIGLIISKTKPTRIFKYYKVICVASAYSMFVLVLFSNGFSRTQSWIISAGYCTVFCLLVAACLLGLRLSNNQCYLGKYYIFLNLNMFISVYLFAYFNYDIFALLIPRVIHDLTAFCIYANHDTNKFQLSKNTQQINTIYSLFHKTKLPIYVLSPTVGISIAFLINNYLGMFTIYVLFVCDFLHYYVESFIWKNRGTHRKYLLVAD
jgi:hypothetical protein